VRRWKDGFRYLQAIDEEAIPLLLETLWLNVPCDIFHLLSLIIHEPTKTIQINTKDLDIKNTTLEIDSET
jgi:hypothetical protein